MTANPREDRRYVVIGAGAVGGTIAALLTRAGGSVVVVARGAQAEALSRGDLVLRTPDGVLRTRVAVATPADDMPLTTADVLVFATKTHQLVAALQQWADRPVHHGGEMIGTAGEVLPVLTALNGVAAEEMALRYFRRVFGVCVWMPAAYVTPGEVIVRSWPVAGQFHISRWPSSLTTPQDAELLSDVDGGWTPAGIRIQRPPDVAPWKYNKLLANLTNAVVALVGSDSGAPEVHAAAIREGQRVLQLAGIDFVPFTESGAARADGPTVRPVADTEGVIPNSTWQSLARRTGDIETDFLNGEIVRIAHRHGATAPVNAGLARLAREAVRDARGPGGYPPSVLAARLGITDGASPPD